jgi:hypothetical protein
LPWPWPGTASGGSTAAAPDKQHQPDVPLTQMSRRRLI